MKRFITHPHAINNIFIIIFCFVSMLFASNTDDKQLEEQYKLRRYEEIKKEKDKEYKKGVYSDDKKDYVNDWIGEDINYQKRVIKLKSDYRAWAEGKISQKEEVNFKDYEPLKTLTSIEKQVLLEYHNKLFGKDEKKIPSVSRKIENKKVKRTAIQKPIEEMPEILKKANTFQPDNISNEENADNKNYGLYLLLGLVGFLFIAGISFLIFKKLHKKSKPKDIHSSRYKKKKKQGKRF